MLTQTAEHALRALLYLAQQPAEVLVPANRIAEATGAPSNYLGKTLQGLATAGLVRSSRGREGGYTLRVPASAITVADVIAAFEAVEKQTRCLLGNRPCAAATPCEAHVRWESAQRVARESVGGITIEDLLSGSLTLAPGRRRMQRVAS